MPIQIPVLLVAAAGIVLLAVGAIQVFMDVRSSMAEDRLSRLRQRRSVEHMSLRGIDPTRLDLVEEEQRARARRGQMMNWLRRQLSPNHWLVEMEKQLVRARAPLGPVELLCLSACLMLGMGCLGYWVFGLGLWLYPVGAGGFALPWLYLSYMQRHWQKKFERQFADALVLMANALRAGYSLLQAVETVARESEYPISDEFQHLSQEIAVGVTVEQALEHLAERVPTMDVKIFVTAVMVQRQIGGALSEILDNLAQVIRQRVTLRGEVRALTAQQQLSSYGLLLLPLFFALTAELLTRALGGTAMGHSSYLAPLLRVPWLIGTGVGMQLIGLFIIRRLVTIEV